MNSGAFGENFPYSNFHDLNMDWIIKIAKDFLDQYTHIQQTIADGETSLSDLTTTGLQQLQDKADNLETLLQAWYDEHSQDIANQLADAIADLNDWYTEHSNDIATELTDAITAFNNSANEKARETIESIPDDYTALSNTVNNCLKSIGLNDPNISDLSTIIKNIIMLRATTPNIGAPSNYGTIVTFCPLDANGDQSNNGAIELWYDYEDDIIHIRRKIGANWGSWVNISTNRNSMQSQIVNASTLDADTIINPSIQSSLIASGISNTPSEYGTLITFTGLNAYRQLTANAGMQLWVDYLDTSIIYFRVCQNNTWQTWNKIVNENTVNVLIDRGITTKHSYPSISTFQSIGIVGDSFASGYDGNTGVDNLDVSWIQVLGRQNGITASNYSQNGLTAREWLVNSNGLAKLLNEPAKELYIIALGLNDAYVYSQDPTYLGSLSDITPSYQSNPDTFYGNMGKIIGNIMDHAPNAKIVFVTTPYGEWYGRTGAINRTQDVAINEAIIAIATYYSAPCLITLTNPLFYSTRYKNSILNNGSHPTRPMYSAMANAYKTMIENEMYDTTYFD